MRGVFVTGTDTGVGKTIVGVALLQAAARRGLRVATMKPIETGCGHGQPADAKHLAHAAGMTGGGDVVCPYRLAAPLAPSLAAQREGVRIELARIERARQAASAADWLLVEGAGGLLVPINDRHTMADVALLFGLPLLIVARDRLGAINHTLLTIEAAARRGLAIAGVVLNAGDATVVDHGNGAEIARVSGVRILGRIPWLLGKVDLGLVAERELDLAVLFSPR